MNLRQLAKELNLSPSTVSLCLTGDVHKFKVSPMTVEKVRQYADKVGYIPNRYAQKIFKKGDSGIVGILLKQDNAIDRNMPILQEAMSTLNDANIEYMILNATDQQFIDNIKHFKGLKIFKIIVIGSMSGKFIENNDVLNDVSLYFIDYRFESPYDKLIGTRFLSGIDRIELYKTLAMTLKNNNYSFMCDINCQTNDLMSLGLLKEDMVIDLSYHLGNYFADGIECAKYVIEKMPKVVILHNDQTAIGLSIALKEQGIRVPEDISIIGFNDSTFSAYAPVPLTTVELPLMSNLKLILEHLIKGTELPKVVKGVPKFIVRNSTSEFLNKQLNKLNATEVLL